MQAIRSLTRFSFSKSIRASSIINQSDCYTARRSPLDQLIRASRYNKMSSTSTPIYTVEYLTDKLKKELDAEHLDIEDLSNCGCGMKFDAVIVSPKFEGKPILQRQRLVNQTLAEEMKHIHAFTMRTLTPNQWKDAMSKKEQGGEA